MISISLNGTAREAEATSIAELVAELGFAKGTVLVELNGTALRHEEWTRELHDGDVLELLRIVAGG